MRYLHRVMIGTFGGIGKVMGAESQKNANRVAYEIGKQVGTELLEQGVISQEMKTRDIVGTVLEALEIGSVEPLTSPTGKMFDITNCNICPKKVGRYPLKATACPVPGIIKGVLVKVEKGVMAPYPDLTPGEKCRIKVELKEA